MSLDPTYPDRVWAVPWGNFAGSCGHSTERLPDLLIQLVNGDAAANAAAFELWNVLSHQANVASSAVPALPFLIEALDVVAEDVAVEIMDILFCFAAWVRYAPPGQRQPWVTELHEGIIAERPRLLRRAEHPNPDIAGFASKVLEVENDA